MTSHQVASKLTSKLSSALMQEDWSTAERLLRQWAKKKSAPATVFFNLAQVLVRSGKSAQAGAWYRKALAVNPDHGDAWCEYGAWRLERGEAAQAANCFAKALALRGWDPDALRGAARSAMRLGDWRTASARWTTVLETAAEDEEASVGLLRAALETGDPIAADLREALAARPSARPALLKALTRTAKGSIPLRPARLYSVI